MEEIVRYHRRFFEAGEGKDRDVDNSLDSRNGGSGRHGSGVLRLRAEVERQAYFVNVLRAVHISLAPLEISRPLQQIY